MQRLIHIDVIGAQCHVDDREEGSKATRFLILLHMHYERHYKVDAPNDSRAPEKTLRDQSTILGPRYVKTFNGLMKGLAKFGHPESPKPAVCAELDVDGLFKDTTHVYYPATSATTLPAEGLVTAFS